MADARNDVHSAKPAFFDRWHYLLATTPFLVVFLLMPFELFFNQADEWDLEAGQILMIPIAGLFGLVVVWLLLSALAWFNQRLAAGFACLLFVLGAYLMLADLYAPVQMAAMEGGALVSDEPPKYTLLELLIGVLALAFLASLWKGWGKPVAVVFSALLALVSIGYGGLVMSTLSASNRDLSRQLAAPKATLGNVYHIVLDRMQTDAFLDVVERMDLRDDFVGFELFINNVANYVTTHPSRASYLSGAFYHQGDFKDWHTDIWRRQGIQKTLADQGYRIWNYVPFRQWQDPEVDVFQYNVDIYEEMNGIEGSGLADFLTLWLLRVAPNALTNEALVPIGGMSAFVLEWIETPAEVTPGDRPKRLTINQGIQVVASKQMFEQMVVDEEKRLALGEYVYLHAVMPHHPYVYDETCRYHGRETGKLGTSDRREGYLDQSACSVRLILDVLKTLKRMNRFDEATVILHADTGAEEGFIADPPDFRSPSKTLGRADNFFLSGANALLAIKRPGSLDDLRENDRATQLVDLFPSLMDILDLDGTAIAPVHGRSIYGDHQGERDVRISLDPEERWGDNYVDVRIENPGDLERSALTVIGPTIEPAHWRRETKQITD